MTADTITVLDPRTYGNGDPTTFGLPLDQYEFMQDELPLLRQEYDDPRMVSATWIVTRHEDVLFVDRSPELFSAAIGPTTIWAFNVIGDEVGAPAMLSSDGPAQSEQRRVVSRTFTPKVVARLEERFRAYAADLVDDALARGDAFDFISAIAHPLPMQALGDILGVPEADRPKFFGYVDTFAGAFDERVTTSYEQVLQAITDLHNYSIYLRDLKREDPGEDVVTQIAASHMADPQTRGNITALACGAAESTRNALGHGVHELMRNPEQMAWLRERADDIPMLAIQEIVRVSSPFTHMLRFATEDVELHGQVIPKGEPVAMMFSAANFDRRAIPDPREFNLAREVNNHVSFGKGPHACIGKHIASLEIKVMLEELLKRTKSITPTGEISYIQDNYSRGVYSLPVEMVAA